MMTLVIKGNKKNATRAAQRRGINIRKCVLSRQGDSVTCKAPCGKHRAVAEWYGEYSPQRKKGGYRPGTLLYFAQCARKK